MRIEEDKIFDIYMKSLISEKKNMPPWLKNKNEGGEKDKTDSKKDDKKSSKKSSKKGLPPWLKGKGKKFVKEDIDGTIQGAEETDNLRERLLDLLNNIIDNLDQFSEDEVKHLYDIISAMEDSGAGDDDIESDEFINDDDGQPAI